MVISFIDDNHFHIYLSHHPQSRRYMYFLNCLCATSISILWSAFCWYLGTNTRLYTSPWSFLIRQFTSLSLHSSIIPRAPARKLR